MLYEFGSCALDTAKRQLNRGGQAVPLAPKTFELLLLLVESDGRALSKAELMQSLWPDTFVEEANLSYQVSTLRKALGDEGARWIETVPKHGYRFGGELARAKPEEAAPEVAAPRLRRISWVIAAALAIAAGTGLVLLRLDQPKGGNARSPVPLTAFPGIQAQPSLSPDGSQVAFAWNGPNEDNYDIYVRLVGPGEPVRLTTKPARDYSPAWSPDGRQIAFLRSVNGRRANLFVIPALGGGQERKLAELELPMIRQDSVLSWAPDSRHIVAGTRFREGEPWGIWLVPVEGGSPQRLTTASAELPFDTGAAFSPDEKSLAFIRVFTGNSSGIWVRSSNGDTKQIAAESGAIRSIAWMDNRRIAFSIGQGPGHSQAGIRVFDVGSGKLLGSPGFGENARALSVSRNGKLVYARQQSDTNLWRFNLADPSASPQRLAPSTYQNWTPAYSHDGKRIAFASTRSGPEEIWVADADGSHPMQVTRMGSGHTSNPRWSPDDQSLVFNSWNPRSSLYSVNLTDGSVTRLTDDPGHQVEPSWSRDGKWVYYGASETGRIEIQRVPAAGGPFVRITRNGGLHAEESSDGKWLYYSKDSHVPTSIWKVARDGGEESLVIDGVSYSLNFVPVEKGIYFISAAGGHYGHSAIEFYEFATGRRKVLATMDKSFSWGLALSPDSKSLVHPLVDHVSSNLMLVEEFR